MTTDPERAESSDVESMEEEEEDKHELVKKNAGNILSLIQSRIDCRSNIEVSKLNFKILLTKI